MFSQYALPNSFADNTNATTYSVSDVNATVTPAIQSVAYQSSSGTSSGSSSVQPVPVQSVSTQAVDTPSVPVQAVTTQTVPVQSVDTHSSYTHSSYTHSSSVQSVTNQSVAIPSVPIQSVANQSSNTSWNRGTIQSHSSQTTSSVKTSNYTPSPQSNTYNSVPSTSPSDLKTTTAHGIQNWLSAYHSATYQTKVPSYTPQYKQYVSSNTPQYQQYVSSPNSPQYQQYVASNIPQSTSSIVTPNSATSYYNDPVTFTATVTDPLTSQSAISGTVSWSDGNSGGTFSSSYCTLYSASCTVTYTPAVNSPSEVTITAYYAGDSAHQSSSGSAYLTVNLDHNTTTTIVANSATYSNEPDTFTATVTDPVGSPYVITGTLSWSDGGIGGTFSSTICTLYSASCSVTYTPPVNSPSSITITGTYSGDSTHRAELLLIISNSESNPQYNYNCYSKSSSILYRTSFTYSSCC